MKKYIVIIIIIGVLLGGVLLYNTIKVEQENHKIFQESGYILQNMSEKSGTENIERYYFNAEEKYKEKYEQKIMFKNTEGEQVTTDVTNFIHYSEGSISAFTNGVLLNLDEIEADPIRYYNISAGKVLKKQGETYIIKNLDQELKFSNVIWKISENKYIILGSNIRIVFDDGTDKIINGYLEFEYLDNEIVKLYNQEATYQTISSKAYIEMPNQIKVNLSTKIVSKENSNKMSLDNMVIDSDDNITIASIETEELTPEEIANANGQTQNNEGEQGGQGGQNNNQQTSTSNNNQQTVINGGQINSDGTVGSGMARRCRRYRR